MERVYILADLRALDALWIKAHH